MNAERGADVGEDLEAEEETGDVKRKGDDNACVRMKGAMIRGRLFFMGRDILPRHTCGPHWGLGNTNQCEERKETASREWTRSVLFTTRVKLLS
jgi:hypothetical protein